MGLIRLLLALSVLAVHFGGIWKCNFVGGQIAVQSFYIISGFYMSLILNEKYVGTNGSYRLFITNRFLRLFPIYWTILILTITTWVVIGIVTNQPAMILSNYSSVHLNIFSITFLIFSNIFIFGQDMVMFLGINAQNGHLFFTSNFANTSPPFWHFLFIPQAWTLGLELMFYLIAPFIVKKSLKVIMLIILLSILLRLFIYNFLHFQNDPWSYRFFPTEICFFLSGNLSYRIFVKIRNYSIHRYIFLIDFLGLGLFTCFFYYLPSLKFDILPFSIKEIIYFSGVIFSIPLLFKFLRKSKFDNQIGELSYPVYISHIFVGMILFSVHSNFVKQGWVIALFTIIVSFLLNYFVSKPIERFRQQRVLNKLSVVASKNIYKK